MHSYIYSYLQVHMDTCSVVFRVIVKRGKKIDDEMPKTMANVMKTKGYIWVIQAPE